MLKNQVTRLLTVCLFLSFSQYLVAQQMISPDRKVHHYFNANLLNPKETQISIVGNVKHGVSPDWELGIQALGFAASEKLPNFYLKHRMFHGENYQTSFVSHSAFNGEKALPIAALDIYSLSGIVTTHYLGKSHQISWGLYDLFIYNNSQSDSSTLRAHIFIPSLSWDYNFTKDWSVTAIYLQSSYITYRTSSDLADIDGDFDSISNPSNTFRALMVTTTYAWRTLHLEAGFIGTQIPYLNIFWRFYAF